MSSKKHSSSPAASKAKREPTAWVNYVRSVYQELKAENPAIKYKEAMLEASKRKKADPSVLARFGGGAKKSPRKAPAAKKVLIRKKKKSASSSSRSASLSPSSSTASSSSDSE